MSGVVSMKFIALVATFVSVGAIRSIDNFDDIDIDSDAFTGSSAFSGLNDKDQDQINVKFERISHAELRKLRTQGLKMHEVDHHYFGEFEKQVRAKAEAGERAEEEAAKVGRERARIFKDVRSALLQRSPDGGENDTAANGTVEDLGDRLIDWWPGYEDKTYRWVYDNEGDFVAAILQDTGISEADAEARGSFYQYCATRFAAGELPGGGSLPPELVFEFTEGDMINGTTPLEKVLSPDRVLSPVATSTFACSQFELNFGSFIGGPLKALASVAFLGTVKKTPANKCFEWNMDLQFQLSFGLSFLGEAFRLSIVTMASSKATEVTLSEAAGSLTWEMPPTFDPTKCHEKNPFSLISHTMREAWKTMRSSVFSNRYLQHPEAALRAEMAKHKEELQAYGRYHHFVKVEGTTITHSAATEVVPQPDDHQALIRNASYRVLAQGQRQGDTLQLMATWLHSGVNEVRRPFKMELRVWQDLGPGIRMQLQAVNTESEEADDWASYRERRGQMPFADVHLQAGVRAIVEVRVQEGEHSWSAPFVVGTESTEFSLHAGAVDTENYHVPETLVVESVEASLEGRSCRNLRAVSVEVQPGAKAFWVPDMFGSSFPVGLDLTTHHTLDIPRQARHDGLIDGTKSIFATQALAYGPNFRLVAEELIRQGVQQSTTWNSLFTDRIQNTLSTLTREAMGVLSEQTAKDFILGLLEAQRERLASNAFAHRTSTTNLLEALAIHAPADVVQCVEMATHRDALINCSTQPGVGNGGFVEEDEEVPVPEIVSGDQGEWMTFYGRTINTQKCSRRGHDFEVVDMDACTQMCEQNAICEIVRMDKDNICSMWACTESATVMRDYYPRAVDFNVALKVAERPAGLATASQIVAGMSSQAQVDALEFAWADEDWDAIYGGAVDLAAFSSAWDDLLNEMNTGEDSIPGFGTVHMLRWDLVKGTVVDAIYQDFSWLSAEDFTHIVQNTEVSDTNTTDDNHVVLISVYDNARKRRNTHYAQWSLSNFDSRRVEVGHNRWTESFELPDSQCKASVSLSLAWSRNDQAAYFKVPNMIPVVQSYFSIFEQFSAKVKPYTEQVVERLTERDGFFERPGLKRLPYGSTDGRLLHRHMNEQEQDQLEVHKGDLSMSGAVYNYPRAFKASRHNKEPTFWYNSGLSVANLFVRALGDFQALFYLYFAGHPDWDGQCSSLPSRHRSFFENEAPVRRWMPFRRNKERTTNEIIKDLGRSTSTRLPTRWAGEVVGEEGDKLTDEETGLFLDWQWISAPRRFGELEKRAEFMKAKAQAFGADGWATQWSDKEEASSTIWPHVWCELSEQQWASEDNIAIRNAMIAKDDEVVEQISALDESDTDEFSFIEKLGLAAEQLKMQPVECPTWDGSMLDDKLTTLQNAWENREEDAEEVRSFFQSEVLPELKSDLEQAFSADPENAMIKAKLNEVNTAYQTLNTIRGSLSQAGGHLNNAFAALLQIRDAFASEEADDAEIARRRSAFLTNRDSLEISLDLKATQWAQVQALITRLLHDYPRSDRTASLDEQQVSTAYAALLVKANLRMQKRVVAEGQLLLNCMDIARRPAELDDARFQPWKQGASRHEKFEEIHSLLDLSFIEGSAIDGIEFFFEDECRVPLDLSDGVMEEPRSECESTVLSKSTMTMLPSVALRALRTTQVLKTKLASLRDSPSEETVQSMVDEVEQFLQGFQGMGAELDDDFYTAFAYNRDGRLFGDMWRVLPDAASKLTATISDRVQGRTEWVHDSIRYAALLENKRRARAKSPEVSDVAEIPAVEDNCVCDGTWSAFVRYGGIVSIPARRKYHGCQHLPKARIMGVFGEDTRTWAGVCKVHQRHNSILPCEVKFSKCDPLLTEDTRPEYFIAVKNSVLDTRVRLPLMSYDFMIGVDIQDRRDDVCTPNWSPLMVENTKHWLVMNYLPAELSVQRCVSGRVQPPGLGISISRCVRENSEQNEEWKSELDAASVFLDRDGHHNIVDWKLSAQLWANSYYNAWGSTDGDLLEGWFHGSWAKKWNFPDMFNGAWGTGDGLDFTQLDTSNIIDGGRQLFWFALIGQIVAGFATVGQFVLFGDHAPRELVVGAVLKIWNLVRKYTPIPDEWNVDTDKGVAGKILSKLPNAKISPWRTEHDVVFNFDFGWQEHTTWQSPIMEVESFSHAQTVELLGSLSSLGVPVQDLWSEHQRGSVMNNHLTGLSHTALSELLQSWWDLSSGSSSELNKLFDGCHGRPVRYEALTAEAVLRFSDKSYGSWLDTSLPLGETVLLTRHSDGWLVEVTPLSEQLSTFPWIYVQTGFLKEASGDLFLSETEFVLLVLRAEIEDVRCWARNAMAEEHNAYTLLDSLKDVLVENCGGPATFPVEESPSEVPLGDPNCFGVDYLRKFWTFAAPGLGSFLTSAGNAGSHSKLQQVLDLFRRGSVAGSYKIEGSMQKRTHRRIKVSAGVDILNRFGLSFIRSATDLWQFQPYIQVAAKFDLTPLLWGVKDRLVKKVTGKSALEEHYEHVSSCEACVDSGMAFCDSRLASSTMLNTLGEDRCMPRNEAYKLKCESFSRADGAPWFGAGGLHDQAMCPCTDKAGIDVTPQWITTASKCRDLAWDGAEEQLRLATKIRDFQLSMGGVQFGVNVLKLDSALRIEYTSSETDCQIGFKCCGVVVGGTTHARCLHEPSLKKGVFRFQSKCRHYNEKVQGMKVKWTEMEEPACAIENDDVNTDFEGYYKRNHKNDWVKMTDLLVEDEDVDEE